jgi:ribosomal protein S18 acetylase RimI-like enzyme
MAYDLTDATDDDAPWLEELSRRAYAALFVATWGRWDEERHRRQFSASVEDGHIALIEVAGERVGMLQLLDHTDALEVAELQIDPRHQGRGIGTAVLRDVLSRAEREGRPVRLKVGLQNTGAMRLYEALGFTVTERSETHQFMTCEPRADQR